VVCFRLMVVFLIALSMAACGGSGSGGSSSVAGSTAVTISLAGSSVAGGALGQAGQVPAGIVSMSVEALDAGGAVIAGPVTATAAQNFTVALRVANGRGITFAVHVFDGFSVKTYEGLSAAQTLSSTALTVPVIMQLWLSGTAAAGGASLANSTLTVTNAAGTVQSFTADIYGQYQGALGINLVYPLLLSVQRPAPCRRSTR